MSVKEMVLKIILYRYNTELLCHFDKEGEGEERGIA